jgi:hypothetical protein
VARTDLGDSRVGWVYRSEPPPAPAPAAGLAATPDPDPPIDSPREHRELLSRGLVAAGLGVLALPFAFTIVAMMAPALWFSVPRSRE